MRVARILPVTVAVTLAVLIGPVSAGASELNATSMQERVDEVLAEYGGEQTGWNEVSWDGGDVVLTLASDVALEAHFPGSIAAAAVDNCAAGKYCAYGAAGYGGGKLTYSSCPATHTSFGAIGKVRSIKNDRSSGTVRAYNGSTLKATLAPGTGASNVSSITKITCS